MTKALCLSFCLCLGLATAVTAQPRLETTNLGPVEFTMVGEPIVLKPLQATPTADGFLVLFQPTLAHPNALNAYATTLFAVRLGLDGTIRETRILSELGKISPVGLPTRLIKVDDDAYASGMITTQDNPATEKFPQTLQAVRLDGLDPTVLARYQTPDQAGAVGFHNPGEGVAYYLKDVLPLAAGGAVFVGQRVERDSARVPFFDGFGVWVDGQGHARELWQAMPLRNEFSSVTALGNGLMIAGSAWIENDGEYDQDLALVRFDAQLNRADVSHVGVPDAHETERELHTYQNTTCQVYGTRGPQLYLGIIHPVTGAEATAFVVATTGRMSRRFWGP